MATRPSHLGSLLIGMLALFIPACHKSDDTAPAPSQREPLAVTLAPIRIGPADRTIDISGTLHGEEEAVISSKLSGRIASITRDVGDAVPPGGVLAQIETRDYDLELMESRAMLQASLAKVGLTELPAESFDPSSVPTVVRARAEEANAEARARRARKLFEQSPPLISEQDYADIQTQWEVARSDAEVASLTARAVLAEARTQNAAVALAQQRLSDTAVRSPGEQGNDGLSFKVSQRLVALGEYVAEGKPMFHLVATQLIKFRAGVPERFADEVEVGQTARVWVEAYTEPVVGTVARISPSIDPQNRVFQVEIHIPNPEERLKPGAFARGQVIVRRDEGVTFVPEASVVTFAGVQKVFTVKDGQAVEHRVQLGIREAGYVEVIGSLGADVVVTVGAPALSPGAAVRITAQPPGSDAPTLSDG